MKAQSLRFLATATAAAALTGFTSDVLAEPDRVFPSLTEAQSAAIAAAVPGKARARPQRPRRLLVFYRTEGYVHESIPYANEAFRAIGERTGAFATQLSQDMNVLTSDGLDRFDAILLNNTTSLIFENPAQREALLGYVRSGKGMAAIHAAADNFYTWPEAQKMLGGVFHSHPWVAGDTVVVKVNEPGHPIVAAFGTASFSIRDEIYQIVGPYDRSRQRELLSLDMSRPENARPAKELVRTDGDFPIAWVKREGRGRVFYTSLGHNAEIYSSPAVLQHYLDGIQYAIGDLKVDDSPSIAK